MTLLSTPLRRVALVGTAAATLAALSLLGTGAASAHVRVFADSPTSGSFSALTFRVPNESDTAGTVKVSVELPQDTPLLYVSTKPVPGWTATTTEAALPKPVESYGTTLTKAVRTVTWTAEKGTQIAPGQYQEFSVSAGPLPAAGTLLLPATQTYSDGEVVKWDEPTPTSGEEPEHPAPEIVVAAAAGAPSASATPEASATPTAPVAAAAVTGDRTARGLGLAALFVAAAGLAVSVVGARRRGRA